MLNETEEITQTAQRRSETLRLSASVIGQHRPVRARSGDIVNHRQDASDWHQIEVDELRDQLEEAKQTILAIRQNEAAPVIVKGASASQGSIFLGADSHYSNILERIRDGVVTLTPGGTVLDTNQRLAGFLGHTLTTIVGQNFAQFVATEDRVLFNSLLKADRVSGEGEFTLRTVDGEPVPVHLSLADFSDDGQSVISGIVTDLREQKLHMQHLDKVSAELVAAIAEKERTQALLRQAQKTEVTGQLTTSIAHDLNNLLLVISGNLELLQQRTSDIWLKRRFDACHSAIEHGVHLTQQLFSLAHRYPG